jgi:hypothetical protein
MIDASALSRWPMGFRTSEAESLTGATARQLGYWHEVVDILHPTVHASMGDGRGHRWAFHDLVAASVLQNLSTLLLDLTPFHSKGLAFAIYLAVEGTNRWDHSIVVSADGAELVSADDALDFLQATNRLAYTIIHVGPIAESVLAKVEAHAPTDV